MDDVAGRSISVIELNTQGFRVRWMKWQATSARPYLTGARAAGAGRVHPFLHLHPMP